MSGAGGGVARSWYLGLSTSGHDPALAICDETGTIRFAEATERFVQDKRAWGIAPDHVPHLSAALAACGADPTCERIVVGTSWATTKAAVDVNVHDAMLPASDTVWMRGVQAERQRSAGASLGRLGVSPKRTVRYDFEHHLCHAAAAAYFAPVENALCLILDGEGDVGAVSLYRMNERRIGRLWRSWGPGSLGTFYAWLTGRCGFDWRLGEEWKVMGLAASGAVNPELLAHLSALLTVDRGRLRFAPDEAIAAVDAQTRRFARSPGDPVDCAADLAATGQAAYAAFADQIVAAIAAEGDEDLILSGGCALNSSYNGTIAGRTGFARVHIPPAPADDGNAIGAALLAFMADRGVDRIPSGDGAADLGTAVGPTAAAKLRHAAQAFQVESVEGRSAEAVATRLAAGKVIGVMRGRAEFGPRALGFRSILADPRGAAMKDRINNEIKGRETFRPFAPMLPERKVADWFQRPQRSPYMSMALPWRPGAETMVPAVVHGDGTGRLQTVADKGSPWLAALLSAFERESGVPITLNTSFNVMGKPIVHSLEDALAVLSTTGLDGVLCDEHLVLKP
ncbi:MAG: carbamoyltransferase C-terminal domain-containing protein [Pseudomonadota bacterium]